MFQRIYDSAWHQPIATWAAGLLILALLATSRHRLRPFAVAMTLTIMLDAYCTGALTPLRRDSPLTSGLALLFVILGDWRYFYLVERERPGVGIYRPPSPAQAGMTAFAFSLAVPVLSFSLRAIFPSLLGGERGLYLAYEVPFALLAPLYAWWRRRGIDDRVYRRWVGRLTAFVGVQYALWALADLLILRLGDAGYAVRLVPNLMYYTAFIPFALAITPEKDQ